MTPTEWDDRVGEAFDHGLDAARDWLRGNLEAGGACDFCARPLPHADAVTWRTKHPVTVTAGLQAETVTHTAPIDYGTDWAACAECDALLRHLTAAEEHVPVEAKAEALAIWALERRDRKRHKVEREAREEMTADELAEFDRMTREQLTRLYEVMWQNGLHRVRPVRLAETGFPVVHEPGGRWIDAYEAQIEQWRWLEGAYGKAWLSSWINLEAKRMPTKKSVYEVLAQVEPKKLRHAAPVYVTADMCDLIDAARQTFKAEVLLEDDVIIPHAFVYFARPIAIRDRHRRLVNVKAISYMPIAIRSEDKGESRYGLGVCLYSSLRADPKYEDDAPGLRHLADQMQAKFGVQVPELTPLHMVPVWYGLDMKGEEIDVDTGEETGFTEWWTLLQVVFRLMAQRIAEPTERVPDRHARKRSERAGFESRNVVVVHLRRARHPRGETPGEQPSQREYTHRWIVGGHWRNQWYRSLQTHRQIWIAPYQKGPEDKPLVLKPRVYEWDR
jgi:hypothetical protein